MERTHDVHNEKATTNNISRNSRIMRGTRFAFLGEFYKEILYINGEKYEHVGFRSDDGSFEDFMNKLGDTMRESDKLRARFVIDFV